MSKRQKAGVVDTARELVAIVVTTGLLIVGTAAIVSVSVAGF